eukprot:6856460-Prymnesium_polylepis.2
MAGTTDGGHGESSQQSVSRRQYPPLLMRAGVDTNHKRHSVEFVLSAAVPMRPMSGHSGGVGWTCHDRVSSSSARRLMRVSRLLTTVRTHGQTINAVESLGLEKSNPQNYTYELSDTTSN